MFTFLNANNTEQLVLILILKYSLPQKTLKFNVHIIYHKTVIAVFQQINKSLDPAGNQIPVPLFFSLAAI
jgi:hypothetical protein